LLGVALMIVFRQPDVNIGYIVMVRERRIQPSIVSRFGLQLSNGLSVAERAVRNLKLDHEFM
jgi:hypothetical protein